MKIIFLTIIGLIIILLVSCITVSQKSDSYVLKTFVVDDHKENIETSYMGMNTFIIEQKPTGRTMLIETVMKTQGARQRNIRYQQRDEEIQKCIDKITKNWKRTYYKRSYEQEYDDIKEKWKDRVVFYEKEREFYGYDKDEDWDLRWRLRNRALNGKKIC